MIQRRIAQQALTYRGDNDRVGNSFSLDGANEALFIKFVVKKNVRQGKRRVIATRTTALELILTSTRPHNRQ